MLIANNLTDLNAGRISNILRYSIFAKSERQNDRVQSQNFVCVYCHNIRGSFGQLWKGKFQSVKFVEHLTSSCTILWMRFSKWVEDQNINPEFSVSIHCLRYL